jgi:hypothetical protein
MRTTTSDARTWCGAVVVTLAACGPATQAEPRETARAAVSPRVEQPSLSESESLRAELARLEAQQRSLQQKLDAQRTEIELQRTELSRSEAARKETERAPIGSRAADPPGTIRGVVQAVNNNVEIVIVSVGTRDGVTVGSEFAVTRDGSPVATIVIDKAFPNYASGTFKSGTPKTPIQSGDECVGRARTDLPK